MHIKKAPLREQWSLDGSFAVLLDDLVPWQDVVEVLWMSLDVGVRQVLEEVLELLERVLFSVKQISLFSSSEFPIVIVRQSPLSASLVKKQVPLLHPAA